MRKIEGKEHGKYGIQNIGVQMVVVKENTKTGTSVNRARNHGNKNKYR